MIRVLRSALVLVLVVVCFVWGRTAGASAYATACPDPATFTAEAAIASADSCAAIAERVAAVADAITANGPPATAVALTGDSLSAVVDSRQMLGYLVGLVAALIFTFTFWRTFGGRT